MGGTGQHRPLVRDGVSARAQPTRPLVANNMSGRHRLPSGLPRRASQRHARPAAPKVFVIEVPWRPGDRVRWRDRTGTYRRDAGDGEHVEIVIAERVYRVQRTELRPG